MWPEDRGDLNRLISFPGNGHSGFKAHMYIRTQAINKVGSVFIIPVLSMRHVCTVCAMQSSQ